VLANGVNYVAQVSDDVDTVKACVLGHKFFVILDDAHQNHDAVRFLRGVLDFDAGSRLLTCSGVAIKAANCIDFAAPALNEQDASSILGTYSRIVHLCDLRFL